MIAGDRLNRTVDLDLLAEDGDAEIGRQLEANDGRERAVDLGLVEDEEIKGNRKKTIFGLPKWAFWSIVAAVVIIVIALAVGLGAGISFHNKTSHNA